MGLYILFKIFPVFNYIHGRQLIYVYRNFNSRNDAIKNITINQWDENSEWTINIKKLLSRYNLDYKLINFINTIKKNHWSDIINNAIAKRTHTDLKIESSGKCKLVDIVNRLQSNHILWEPTIFNGCCEQTGMEIRFLLHSLPAAGNRMQRGSFLPMCTWCESCLDTNDHFISCPATVHFTTVEKIRNTLKT